MEASILICLGDSGILGYPFTDAMAIPGLIPGFGDPMAAFGLTT